MTINYKDVCFYLIFGLLLWVLFDIYVALDGILEKAFDAFPIITSSIGLTLIIILGFSRFKEANELIQEGKLLNAFVYRLHGALLFIVLLMVLYGITL